MSENKQNGKHPDFHTMRRDAIDTLKHHYDDIRSAVVSVQPGKPQGLRPFLRDEKGLSASGQSSGKKTTKTQKILKKKRIKHVKEHQAIGVIQLKRLHLCAMAITTLLSSIL